MIEARIENIEAHGGNSFSDFSLPEAILKFRQGVGRLIRTKTDTGIVVVLDNRILVKRLRAGVHRCAAEVSDGGCLSQMLKLDNQVFERPGLKSNPDGLFFGDEAGEVPRTTRRW